MDVSAALASLTTEARGLLAVDTQTPLSLYGCEARLRVLGYSAQLSVQLDYVNESNANQSVVAAHAIPLHWQLMECAVHYDGEDRLHTFYDKTLQPTWSALSSNAGAGGTTLTTTLTTTTARGSQPALTVYEQEACTVALQAVPWVMRIGSHMVLSATYAIPLAGQQATMPSTLFELALPAQLFLPSPYSPAEVNIAYNALFAHNSNTSGEGVKQGGRLAPGLTLHAECDLFSPLRGPVTLARADDKNTSNNKYTNNDDEGGDDEVLECEVEYVGDSRFVLHYRSETQDCVALYKAQRHRPFVLRCNVHESGEPLRLFVERDATESTAQQRTNNNNNNDSDKSEGAADNTYAIAIALTPALARCEVNAECVFVLDLHRGGSAACVAAALTTALRALPESVRVNVILYDAHDEAMSALYKDGSVPVQTMDLAALHDLVCALPLPSVDPGTPQGAATRVHVLHDILHRSGRCGGGPSPAGYVRHILWISDAGQTQGAVQPTTSMSELLREARQAQGAFTSAGVAGAAARLSAVSLSYSLCADEALLRLLAREGGGVFARAACAEEVAGAVVRVLAACAVPTLSEARVTFPDYDDGINRAGNGLPRSSAMLAHGAEHAKHEACYTLPAIAHGAHGCFYVLAPAAVKQLAVCVTGRVGSAVLEYTASCEMARTVMLEQNNSNNKNGEEEREGDAKMLHVAAAAARIACLAARATTSALTRAEIDEMVGLSRDYALPCPFTQLCQRCSSALAAGPLVGRGTMQQRLGEAERRAVRCWYNRHGAVCAKEWQALHQAQLTRQAQHLQARRVNAKPLAPQLPRPAITVEAFAQEVLGGIVEAVLAGPDVSRLLQLQDRRAGGFALDARLARCLGRSEAVLRAQQPGACTNSTLWATVLAIAYMEHVHDDLTLLALRRARQCAMQMAGGDAQVAVPWQDWLSSAAALVAATD